MREYNYDILFIGGLYEEGKEKEYLDKTKSGGIQNAVNTHQWNFIHGLDYNNETPVNILSARYVNVYPKYEEIYVKRNRWQHKEGANDENIGFINIKIIKNLIRKRKLAVQAKKWSRLNDGRKKVVICYHPSIPQMQATIKIRNKDIIKILIIPDIPKFMNLQEKRSKIEKTISKKIEKSQEDLIKQFDGFILLTSEMAKELEISHKKNIIIEGIIDKNEINQKIDEKKVETKNIVYSGSLHKKYGLESYIEAIKLIKNPEINFYIFGAGEMEQEIIELSKIDKRIKFMGYRTRKEILEYQRNASLLINPRYINEEFVKYSFPSKLIEYMLSGTPVLTSKLPSIPEEYFEYLFFIEGEVTPESIKNSILQTLCLEEKELVEKGERAREFVLTNKNYEVQGEKILKLINDIEEEKR